MSVRYLADPALAASAENRDVKECFGESEGRMDRVRTRMRIWWTKEAAAANIRPSRGERRQRIQQVVKKNDRKPGSRRKEITMGEPQAVEDGKLLSHLESVCVSGTRQEQAVALSKAKCCQDGAKRYESFWGKQLGGLLGRLGSCLWERVVARQSLGASHKKTKPEAELHPY